MNVGIFAKDFVEWGGGLDFIRLLSTCLYQKGSKKYDTKIFVPLNQCKTDSRISNSYAFIPNEVRDFFSSIIPKERIIFYSSSDLNSQLEFHKIQLLLPVHTSLSKKNKMPWIGYIYDFQHKYIPENYSKEEITRRNRLFEKILRKANSVIVNSHMVKKDVESCFPDYNTRVFALPFAPIAPTLWFENHLNIIQKYNLPKNFFIVCNQFWIHKEHKTAIRAFKSFLEYINETDIHLILTGRMSDRRFIPKEHLSSIISLIESQDLSEKVHLFGHIPKIEQIQMIKQSIGLIQPSLFEGGPGGGSVYDAVSLGVPCIVADIQVNREIEAPNVLYFKSKSYEELALKMVQLFNEPKSKLAKKELIEQQSVRMNKLFETLDKAIEYSME